MSWQPIETAPKDLPPIIWLADASNMRLAMWHATEERWIDLAKAEGREAVRGLHFTPTHWQQIPEPPK